MNPAPEPLPHPIHSILFLCHGNIIRSALAEALFRHEFPNGTIHVASAGIRAQPGREPDSRACDAAESFCLSLNGHRARALTAEMLSRADVIFLMDELNESLLLATYPSAKPRIRYLGEWNRNNHSRVIADPYMGSLEDVHQCAEEIRACTSALADELLRPLPPQSAG